MARIALCCVARNEERRMERLLRSVAPLVWEAHLIDNASTDDTARIFAEWAAARLGDRWSVTCEEEVRGYPDWLYNRCFGKVRRSEWILMLDGDEAVTDAGRERIPGLFDRRPEVTAWELPWTTIVTDAWDGPAEPLVINEHHVRLFRRGAMRHPDDALPHSVRQPVGEQTPARLEWSRRNRQSPGSAAGLR